PLVKLLLGLLKLGEVVGGILEADKLAAVWQIDGFVEAARPGHQLERGTTTAPFPANVRASCSARFLVGIPEIVRRLALSSKGNCRTIVPSSDVTSNDAGRSIIFMPHQTADRTRKQIDLQLGLETDTP